MPDAMQTPRNKEQSRKADRPLTVYVSEKERQPGERGFAFLLFLLGALGYYFALDLSNDSYSAPSVFPKIASVVIMAGGLISLFRACKRNISPTAGGVLTYLLPRTVTIIVVLVVLYCLALPRLHFPLTSFLFLMLSMSYLYKGRHLLRLSLYSVAVITCLILLFRYVMLVILP